MLKRIFIYLKEMFPLSAFLVTLLCGLSIQLIYIRLFDLRPSFNFQIVLSSVVLTSITLLIRIMDEFKDYEDDLRNFPMRPLPSGRVKHKDLKILGFICVTCILLLSLTKKSLFLWSLVSLGYTFLMLKWFFIEKQMRKSLPLAFISHHPIVLLNFVYLILSCVETFSGVDWSKSLYVLPIALIFTNWEVARKIRSPEQETAYTTYSKIFGPRIAITISLILQIIYTLTILRIFSKIESPLFLSWIFSLLMTILIFPSLRFLFTLKLTSPLKIIAEGQILLVISFVLVAALL